MKSTHVLAGTSTGSRSTKTVLAGLFVTGAFGAGPAILADSPPSMADPQEQHTVIYQITGAGHAFSIVADPGPSVYPDGNNYPSLPWSTTVEVHGHPLVEISFTERDGGPHDCSITVDGKVAPVAKPSAGLCTYQIPAGAGQDLPYGPDTCKHGFVWRDARPDDHVCVTPQTRDETAQENAEAAARRDPNGGAYGPDTCRQGFVWRDAFPGDNVCVTPESRTRAAADNAAAASRRVVG